MLMPSFRRPVIPPSVRVIYHSELYRLVWEILILKCLRSGITASTEYALTELVATAFSEAWESL
ncbi:MAG: hypothetical protein ACTS73_05680 [Arsenophonus sp. NEOnobi-MAG3]